MKQINLAILGFGTVGSGVYQVLKEDYAGIIEKLNRFTGQSYALNIKRIVEIREEAYRPELAEIMSPDLEDVLDDDIHIVCELIGGDTVAKEYMKRAMDRGFHVVTANKMAIFTGGGDLLEYAREKGVVFKYEASVAGAIPLIKASEEFLIADEVYELQGILNGSTNYILSKIKAGLSYDEALDAAREKGYLEADPSSDILGYDAMYKLGILGNLLVGEFPKEEEIERQGIDGISAEDIERANRGGQKIKLISAMTRDNGKPCYSVKPELINPDNPLYYVDDSINGILFRCRNSGDILFKGAGAGARETAVSIISDIISIIRSEYA